MLFKLKKANYFLSSYQLFFKFSSINTTQVKSVFRALIGWFGFE